MLDVGRKNHFYFSGNSMCFSCYLSHECIRSQMKLNRPSRLRLVYVLCLHLVSKTSQTSRSLPIHHLRPNDNNVSSFFIIQTWAALICVHERCCKHLHASRTNSIIKKYKFLLAIWMTSMNEQTTSWYIDLNIYVCRWRRAGDLFPSISCVQSPIRFFLLLALRGVVVLIPAIANNV